MKIAIIGYGKMGHIVEETALMRGHTITCRIDKDNRDEIHSDLFRSSDVAIEFSTPSTAVANMLDSFKEGVPVVCGTTGWLDNLAEVEKACADSDSALIHATNFSIGVNIFRAVNSRLASIMSHFGAYHPSMMEVHHIHKLDHPSGTAITLADDILKEDSRLKKWAPVETISAPSSDILPIESIREGEVPGIHSICWDSDVDSITIYHSAKSRHGFAVGAVMAAEWLATRKGVYGISDMFDSLIAG